MGTTTARPTAARPAPATATATSRGGRSRLRYATLAGGGLALAVALALGGAGDAPASQAQRPRQSPGAAQIRSEIDGMIAEGVSPTDPKVQMLRNDARALDTAAAAPPQADPGVDANAVAAKADAGQVARTPAEAQARTEEMRSTQPAVRGTILCEPVPGMLTAAEVAGATCYSVPQADGTSRFVAVTPAGKVLVVEFAPGGDVHRLPDAALPPGTTPAHATVSASTSGDLVVSPPGRAAASVDLG